MIPDATERRVTFMEQNYTRRHRKLRQGQAISTEFRMGDRHH